MRPPQILIVDDEENVALILRAGLEKLEACEITTALSGQAALQLFEQTAFDLLITDYTMPDMDGMMLAEKVRQRSPRTHIILITAHGTEGLQEQATRFSIRYILDKPISLSEIRRVAQEVLKAAKSPED